MAMDINIPAIVVITMMKYDTNSDIGNESKIVAFNTRATHNLKLVL